MKTSAFLILTVTSIAFAQVDEWKRLMDRGMSLEDDGEYAAAAREFGDAVRLAELSDHNNARLVLAINSLAITLEEIGQFSQAERQYGRALLIVDKTRGRDNPEYAMLLTNLATLLGRNGASIVKREALLRESRVIFAKVLPAHAPQAAIADVHLAELLMTPRKRKYAEAEELLKQSLAAIEQPGQPAWKNVGSVLNDLGLVNFLQGRIEDAEVLFEKSLTVLEQQGPDHPTIVTVLNNLALAYVKERRLDDADAAFRRALLVADKRLAADHPIQALVLQSYADYLRHSGQKRKAKQLQARAEEMLRENAYRNSTTVDASTLLRK